MNSYQRRKARRKNLNMKISFIEFCHAFAPQCVQTTQQLKDFANAIHSLSAHTITMRYKASLRARDAHRTMITQLHEKYVEQWQEISGRK